MYEYVSIFNNKSEKHWVTRDFVVDSQGAGSKPVSVNQEGTPIYPKGNFGKYDVISKWKSQVKKGGNLEQKAFNWLWEPKVTHTEQALQDLKNGTNPVTEKGTYWDELAKTNFSIIEQLNFYNGAGIDCLRGKGAYQGRLVRFNIANREKLL